MTTRRLALAGAAALALALAGCSSGGDDSGIAQLDDAGDTGATAQADAGSAEDQALAFAQCMRDNGVDFPDPTVDADGNPSFDGAFQRGQGGGFDPGDSSFRDAMDACGDLAQGLVMGGGRGGFDSDAMNEALYQYTSCLREQGLDVGDITLDGMMGGRGGGAPSGDGTQAGEPPADAGDGQPAAPPEGERGPGGDPTDRFAERLGQDPDDPAWIAANGVCQPVLEDAMSAAGMPGAGGAAS